MAFFYYWSIKPKDKPCICSVWSFSQLHCIRETQIWYSHFRGFVWCKGLLHFQALEKKKKKKKRWNIHFFKFYFKSQYLFVVLFPNSKLPLKKKKSSRISNFHSIVLFPILLFSFFFFKQNKRVSTKTHIPSCWRRASSICTTKYRHIVNSWFKLNVN